MRRKIKQLRKIKVGIVNYLNTAPLLYGIRHSQVSNKIDLIEDYPSRIATLLLDGEIDIGLVPVAILPDLPKYEIVTDYCIGSNGPVASVCLFSDVPIQDIDRVLLDYQSRTSVALLKILLQSFWKVNPELVDANKDYLSSIKGSTAGLVIGDRSFEQRQRSTYVYDLGEAWKKYTGLPFVFATWTASKLLDRDFVDEFNAANQFGIQHIQEVIDAAQFPLFDLKAYYTKFISYPLDEVKKKGLAKFLQLMTVAV